MNTHSFLVSDRCLDHHNIDFENPFDKSPNVTQDKLSSAKIILHRLAADNNNYSNHSRSLSGNDAWDCPVDLRSPSQSISSFTGSSSCLTRGDKCGSHELCGFPLHETLPAKLTYILARKHYQHMLRWAPHGRAFMVVDLQLFHDVVLPLLVNYEGASNRFTTFIRLLKLWGFRQLTKGPDTAAYYHEVNTLADTWPHNHFLSLLTDKYSLPSRCSYATCLC